MPNVFVQRQQFDAELMSERQGGDVSFDVQVQMSLFEFEKVKAAKIFHGI